MQPTQFGGINVLKEDFIEGQNKNVDGGNIYGAFETRPIWKNKGPQPMTPITDDMLNQALSDDLGIADLKLQPEMALPWASMKECKLYNTDEDKLKGKIDFLRAQLGFLPLEMSRKWQKNGSVMNQNIKMVSYNDTIQVIPQSNDEARMAILNALVPLETEYALIANESQFRQDFKDWLEGKRPTHEYAPCAWLDDKTKKMVPMPGRDDGSNRAVLEAARSLVNVNPGFARTGILLWENIIKKAREKRVRRRLAAMTPLNDEEAWVYYSIVVRKMPLEFIASHSYNKPPPEEDQPSEPPAINVSGDDRVNEPYKTIPAYLYASSSLDSPYDSAGNFLELDNDALDALNANAKQQVEAFRDSYFQTIPMYDDFSRAKRNAHMAILSKHEKTDANDDVLGHMKKVAELEEKMNRMSKSQVDALASHKRVVAKMQEDIAKVLNENEGLRNQVHTLSSDVKDVTTNAEKARKALQEAKESAQKELNKSLEASKEKIQELEKKLESQNANYTTATNKAAELETEMRKMQEAIDNNAGASAGELMNATRKHHEMMKQQAEAHKAQIEALNLTLQQKQALYEEEVKKKEKVLEAKHAATVDKLAKDYEEARKQTGLINQKFENLKEDIKKKTELAQQAAATRATTPPTIIQQGNQQTAIASTGHAYVTTAGTTGEGLRAIQDTNETADSVQRMEAAKQGNSWDVRRFVTGWLPGTKEEDKGPAVVRNTGDHAFQKLMAAQAALNTDKEAHQEATKMVAEFEAFLGAASLKLVKDATEYVKTNQNKRYQLLKPEDGILQGTDVNEAMRSENFGVALAVINLEAHAYSLGIDFPTKNTKYSMAEMHEHGLNVAKLIIDKINKMKGENTATIENLGSHLRVMLDPNCKKTNILFSKTATN